MEVFADVPQFEILKADLENGIPVIDFLAEHKEVLPYKGEARRMLKANSISINKEQVGEEKVVDASDLLGDQNILVQKGKKNYFLISVKGWYDISSYV